MSDAIALSWSRLSTYRQCPKQFEAKYISKSYPDESSNPAFTKGNKIHSQVEEYINAKKQDAELPTLGKIASNAIPIVNRMFDSNPAESISAELQVAVDHDWNQVGWFDSADVIKYRSIMDMLVIGNEKATILDWKTGKHRPYADEIGQLHLSSSIIFEMYPSIQEITNAYLFLEHKKTDKHVFTREDHPKTRAKFDVEYIEINEDEEFAPKKNSYCHFCLIKSECPYG